MGEFIHLVRYQFNHNQLGGLNPSSSGFIYTYRVRLRNKWVSGGFRPGNHRIFFLNYLGVLGEIIWDSKWTGKLLQSLFHFKYGDTSHGEGLHTQILPMGIFHSLPFPKFWYSFYLRLNENSRKCPLKMGPRHGSNLSVHRQMNGYRRCGTYMQWNITQP